MHPTPRRASGSAIRPVPMPSGSRALAGQVGEKGNDWVDDGWDGLVGTPLVEPFRYTLAEMVLGHGLTIASSGPPRRLRARAQPG